MARPRDAEIYSMIDQAVQTDGKCFALTYEEGVEEALRWVLGDQQDPPIEVG